MKKSIKYVSVSTVILALIVVTIFGINADAAGGVKTTYGRRLQEQSPESLDSSYAGWSWVDTGNDDYFGNVGEQAFVIAKGGKYRTLTVDVEPKVIKPTVKIGSSASTIPSLWGGNSSKAKISTYQHKVTVTAGTGGTVSGGGTYTQGDDYTIKATASSGYKFVKWSDGNTSASRTITMGSNNASYTATFETNGTVMVTSSLPSKINDVSIMTLGDAYNALTDYSGIYRYDPYNSYTGSKYYIYITTNYDQSTAENLRGVGINWYSKYNKPTAYNSYWTVGYLKLAGGPLSGFKRGDNSSNILPIWWYSSNGTTSTNLEDYWDGYGSPTKKYVAVVRVR